MAILPELKLLIEDLVNTLNRHNLNYELNGFDGRSGRGTLRP
jgi:hypothetical protein